jgi:acetyl-CoA acetyltransferase
MNGAMAIASGMANNVLVFRTITESSNRLTGSKDQSLAAKSGPRDGTFMWQGCTPFNVLSVVNITAMYAAAHMQTYGTTPEQLAQIALTTRRNAQLNPKAVMRKPMTMDDYMASRYICEPLRLLDYCLINDGGVAMILTAGDRAKDFKQPPVYVRGLAQVSRLAQGELPDDFGFAAMQRVSGIVHDMAEVGRDEVDGLMIYDNFTPIVLFALEGFGYCPKGEGGRFVEGGALQLGGRMPTNTNGGHLSESYMQGWNLQAEAVRQLRGGMGERQIPDAKVIQYLQGGPLSASIIYAKEPA